MKITSYRTKYLLHVIGSFKHSLRIFTNPKSLPFQQFQEQPNIERDFMILQNLLEGKDYD